MHNIKDIRANLENFVKTISKRNHKVDQGLLESLDTKNRDLIQKKENLEQEKKIISKSKDKSLFEKSKKLSNEIDQISSEQLKIKKDLDNLLSNIPNLPLADVPEGSDESHNTEVEKKGKIPEFKFKPKSHSELGSDLSMIDFDLATKTTGSRFVFLKEKIALLERALSNFMID